MSKPTLILAAVAVALVAWMTRYDLQTGTSGAAHVLDRWTGDIRWVVQNEAEPVTQKAPDPVYLDPDEVGPVK